MKFGTIGAGAVALAFGREALARGHEVVLSSRRGPDALVDKVAELGRGASCGLVEKPRASTMCCSPCLGRNVGVSVEEPTGLERPALIDRRILRRDESDARLADLAARGE